MFDVVMQFQCGCFKRKGYSAVQSFSSKDEAITKAHEMVIEMTNSFCGAHSFCAVDEGEQILITVKSNF